MCLSSLKAIERAYCITITATTAPDGVILHTSLSERCFSARGNSLIWHQTGGYITVLRLRQPFPSGQLIVAEDKCWHYWPELMVICHSLWCYRSCVFLTMIPLIIHHRTINSTRHRVKTYTVIQSIFHIDYVVPSPFVLHTCVIIKGIHVIWFLHLSYRCFVRTKARSCYRFSILPIKLT